MDRAVIFGGLSPFGFVLTNALLANGYGVTSLSSATSVGERKQEEEREMYVGRNAFFHASDASDALAGDAFFFADTRSPLQRKILHLVRSHPAVCRADVLLFWPAGAVRKTGDDDEFVRAFVTRRTSGHQVRTIVLRTDDAAVKNRKVWGKTAQLAVELIRAEVKGSQTIHYFSGLKPGSARNRALRQLLGERIDWL